jgi:Ser/Thr protein kinase RdoA (MazF antagonist)
VRILQERLAALANRRPALRDQLTRVFEGCQRLAATLPDVPLVPAHRDFYADQVVVDGSRVVLLDLDLYSLAHPALDVGNCIAHLVELGFRRPHRATLFDDAAQTMREAMAAAISASAAPGIDAFVTLTLARLVDIDDRFDDRRGCVLPLLEECERRLAQAQVLPPPRASVAV